MSVSPRSPQPMAPMGEDFTSNSQLASLLATALRDGESLKKELVATRKRAEKAERLVGTLSSIQGSPSQSTSQNSNQPPSPAEATRLIMTYESIATSAERARDDALARLRMMQDNWSQLDKYLAMAELRATDARNGFSRIVAEGGGELQLASIPMPSGVMSAPGPPIHSSRHHSSRRHMGANTGTSTPAFPALPLPPPPNPNAVSSSRVRPRAGSLDGAGPPPSKRPRSMRDDSMHVDGTYPPSSHHSHPNSYTHPPPPHQSHHAPQQYPGLAHSSNSQGQHPIAQPRLIRPPSRASSSSHQQGRHHGHRYSEHGGRARSSSSASSLSVDEMLLQTAGGEGVDGELPDPAGHPQTHAHRGRPRPSSSHSQNYQYNPGQSGNGYSGGQGQGPASQMTTYQTHVFAPVVTGAPVKKNKGSGSVHDVHSPPAPPQPPPAASYPPTNAANQRICRQCGLPGRYKDGKCVEKWGPGPLGPGTVCDRCRKKMKRVERRGTLDAQLNNASNSTFSHPPPSRSQSMSQAVHRSDTIPNISMSGSNHVASALAGSHPGFGHLRDRDPVREKEIAREREREPQESSLRSSLRPSPSPHKIHASPGAEDADGSNMGSRIHSRANSRSRNGTGIGRSSKSRPTPPVAAVPEPHHSPSPTKRSPLGSESIPRRRSPMDVDADPADVDGDADADADADLEADGDAELELGAAAAAASELEGSVEGEADPEVDLLEAVDAAEANSNSSSSATGVRLKSED